MDVLTACRCRSLWAGRGEGQGSFGSLWRHGDPGMRSRDFATGRTHRGVLSTHFHKYGNVCGGGLRGEVAKRGGGDAEASATTNDKEIARNPHPPKGLGRDGPISLLLLLADVSARVSRHRLVVAPRSGLRRAPNTRHRIYGREYSVEAHGRAPLQNGASPLDRSPKIG